MSTRSYYWTDGSEEGIDDPAEMFYLYATFGDPRDLWLFGCPHPNTASVERALARRRTLDWIASHPWPLADLGYVAWGADVWHDTSSQPSDDSEHIVFGGHGGMIVEDHEMWSESSEGSVVVEGLEVVDHAQRVEAWVHEGAGGDGAEEAEEEEVEGAGGDAEEEEEEEVDDEDAVWLDEGVARDADEVAEIEDVGAAWDDENGVGGALEEWLEWQEQGGDPLEVYGYYYDPGYATLDEDEEEAE